jgi:D-xylulose kinase
MPDLYAALDLGTTGTRTIIFDNNGGVISSYYKEWKSIYPSPVMVEQDALSWWNALKKTIEMSIKKGNVDPSDIKSLAITNQRETIVPVDIDGNPLHNAIVWQDRRTIDECNFIKEKIGADKIYNTTGLTIDPYFSGSKILWIKNHKPEIYQKTHKFLLVHDFIVNKLTGKWVSDHSNASRTMLLDINNLKWSEDIASALELDLDKMPDPVPSGQLIGNITTDETAFDKNTVVISGGGDQQCAALGVGVTIPGRIKCTTGTGSFILSYLEKPKFDPSKRVLCSCHTVPGAWIQEASIFTSGAALRWIRDEICTSEVKKSEEEDVDPYVIMDNLAEETPIGSNGISVIPHFVGAGAPHWNPNARGVIFGISLGNKRSDIIRAVMEGVAYEIRKNVEVFKELGSRIEEMRITGGGSRSSIWNQIQADVLNITCARGELEESTAVGAAILASYGVGDFKSLTDAAEQIANISKKWEPKAEAVEIYNKIYNKTVKLYEAIEKAGLYQ